MSNDKLFLYDKIDCNCRDTKMLLKNMLENNSFYEFELLKKNYFIERFFFAFLAF